MTSWFQENRKEHFPVLSIVTVHMVFVHRSHCYLFTPPHLFQQFPQIPDQISQFPLGPVSRLPEILPGNLTDLFQMVGDGIPVEEAASRQIPVLLLAHV